MVDLSYTERPECLQTRIEAHARYSRQEINDWIIECLGLKPGLRVLDLTCGNGKQVMGYARAMRGSGRVVGMDISPGLLGVAREKVRASAVPGADFVQRDANRPLPFIDGSFARASCCFGIYYLHDVARALRELKRVLQPGGRLLLVGPAAGNAAEIFRAHQEITGQPLPPTAVLRTDRMEREIGPRQRRIFGNLRLARFTNAIDFPSVASILDYYRSSLLLEETVKSGMDQDELLHGMERYLTRVVERSGKFTLTKRVVGGISEKDLRYNGE